MLLQFREGIRSFFEAHKFIVRHRLWLYVLFPGVLNLILFILLIIFSWQFSDFAISYLQDWLGIEVGDGGWLRSLVVFLSSFLIRIFLIMLYLLIYKDLVLIIFSPIMSLLAEKCLEICGHSVPPFSWPLFLKNIARAIRIAVVNIVKELFLVVLLTLLSSILFFGLITPILIWIISSYYYGYSMFDYVSEIKEVSIKEGSKYVWRNKGAAVAIGGSFYFILTLPVIGLLIAPSYGIVSGVLYMNKNQIQTN